MRHSVCLISSNDLSREGLNAILSREGFDVVCAESDFKSLHIEGDTSSMIIVVDLCDTSDLPAITHSILSRYPEAHVALLVDRFDFESTVDCYNAGAKGYIVKSTNSKPLTTAMSLIALGERFFPSQVLDELNGDAVKRSPSASVEEDLVEAKLSPRELDVLCCLMAGYPNKVIARKLDVCEATIKVHVKAILRKLNVNNRTQAAIWASSHNLSDSAGAQAR